MAYNQPLALGLAIGIPCFLVLLACSFLVIRHRRIQKQEDQAHDDVELGDNDSFKGFEQALHQPQANKTLSNGQEPTEKASMSSDTNMTRPQSRSTSHFQNSSGGAEETTVSPFGSASSVADASASNTAVSIVPRNGSARDHKKSGSVYDFYDSFIPIAEPEDRTPRNGSSATAADFSQPPAISSDRQSIQSQSNSLIGVNRSDRSLDNLAKQLHGHVFSEKFPTQRGVINGSPKKLKSASSNISEEWSPSKDTKSAQFTIADSGSHISHPYRAKAVEGKPALSLQDNFDNNITADTDFDDAPAVIFK